MVGNSYLSTFAGGEDASVATRQRSETFQLYSTSRPARESRRPWAVGGQPRGIAPSPFRAASWEHNAANAFPEDAERADQTALAGPAPQGGMLPDWSSEGRNQS